MLATRMRMHPRGPLLIGLEAYYALNGNSEDAVGSNDGSDTAITYSAGKIGSGAEFNGSTSFIALAAIPDLATSFTVAGWIKPDVVTGIRAIYAIGSQTNRLWIYANGTTIFAVEDNIADYSLGGVLSNGVWQHIAIVKDSDVGTNLRGYLNGSQIGTAAIGTITTPSGSARFGDSGFGAFRYDGMMDEFGLWSRALSGAEVTELYNGGAGKSYPF